MNNNFPLQLSWANRQRELKVNFKKIKQLTKEALPLCAEKPRCPGTGLPQVIEVTLLSDRAITKVHADFLNDPTPTDVITFRHSKALGEILVGVPTAARHAKEFHHPVDHEIVLCVIHGLLHLLGYDDMTSSERDVMHQRQDDILKRVISKETLRE